MRLRNDLTLTLQSNGVTKIVVIKEMSTKRRSVMFEFDYVLMNNFCQRFISVVV